MEYFAIIDRIEDNKENKSKSFTDITMSKTLKSLELDAGLIKIYFHRNKLMCPCFVMRCR